MKKPKLNHAASAGFTLIEILAGVGIFLVGVVSIMALFGVAIDTHKRQVNRSTATIVARRAFTHMRAFPPSETVPTNILRETWFARPAPSALPLSKDATTIPLESNPARNLLLQLDNFLAVTAKSGVFWTPSPGRPAFALIVEDDPTKNEWISFEAFQESPSPVLLGCSRGQLGTKPREHEAIGNIKIVATFYFPDYPTYSFRLRRRAYAQQGILFNILDVIVVWSELGRAREATFSYALSDRTQYDLSGTEGVFP